VLLGDPSGQRDIKREVHPSSVHAGLSLIPESYWEGYGRGGVRESSTLTKNDLVRCRRRTWLQREVFRSTPLTAEQRRKKGTKVPYRGFEGRGKCSVVRGGGVWVDRKKSKFSPKKASGRRHNRFVGGKGLHREGTVGKPASR